MEKINELIAVNIRKLRNRLNLTQSELAEKADLSLRGIQAIESEDRAPRSNTLSKIAKALGVAEGELYKDDRPQFIQAQVSSRAENLTLLYSVAPGLSEDDLQTVVNLAQSLARK